MRILGIETSCDETAICLVDIDERTSSVQILGNTVHSQIDMHIPYGGVFPTIAKREHQLNLFPVLIKTLEESKMRISNPQVSISNEKQEKIKKILERESDLLKIFKEIIPTIEKPKIDAIAVTYGPGLEPALWVGIGFARALSVLWDIPIIPVNHMEGHILISLLEKKNQEFIISKPEFPAITLLISGGHTELVLVKDIGSYEIVGKTRDDAIGECFDKIARMLGLPYPGGPRVSELADIARNKNIKSPEPLPRPMIHSKDLDFSFSGLKTAVLYLVKKLGALDEKTIQGICCEAENAITDVIVAKTKQAIEKYDAKSLIVGGGVIANTSIRSALSELSKKQKVRIYLPDVGHATDNALMIALAGFENRNKTISGETVLKALGNLKL